jgi:hypothetical protein
MPWRETGGEPSQSLCVTPSFKPMSARQASRMRATASASPESTSRMVPIIGGLLSRADQRRGILGGAHPTQMRKALTRSAFLRRASGAR